MTKQQAPLKPAGGTPVDCHARPVAWAMSRNDGLVLDVICPDEHDSHEGEYTRPLYDRAALDAALALWPRDCRLCAKFTTQTGGCTSTVQCVDSDQYKATTPRQYWVSGPNVADRRPVLRSA